jgi:CheY-like chemotaxis protein
MEVPSPASERPVVLYVDDVNTNLMLFKASFEKDYSILLAESGSHALDILNDQPVNVIVADQRMPEITGSELLAIVAEKYPDIMRFMITAHTDYETVVEAINKGRLYGFFNKPYKIQDIRQAINKSLEVQDLKLKNKQMLVELEKANELMLGLDHAKNQFISSITEDIRDPINRVVTAIHMIKDKIDSRDLSELLYQLDVSVQNLERFSEAAEHFSRLNAKGYKLDKQQISLSEVVEVAILDKGNLLQQQDVDVQLDTAETDIKVAGEFDLILAAFNYLLGYLLNHAGKGAKINLSVSSNETVHLIDFQSDQIQLSEKEIREIRSVTSENYASDGDFRLELALVAEIMKAHEGKFLLQDTDDNYSFILRFMT